MPVVSVKVTIPEGYELAFDAMRPPREGELFVNSNGSVDMAGYDHVGIGNVILRHAFKWPSWLKAAAIAKDRGGEWYAYSDVPELDGSMWSSDDGDEVSLDGWLDWIQLVLPDVPWEESLRINPNYKAE